MERFGEVVDVNMPRDKETHKPKGFAFVMYEDQRSTVLAVDNMNGAQVLGRTIRVSGPTETNSVPHHVSPKECLRSYELGSPSTARIAY